MHSVNKNEAIINEDNVIFVVSFKRTDNKKLSSDELVKLLQSELYDKHGTSGYFRIAPALKENLTEEFIYGFKNMPDDLFMPVGDDVKVAFLVDATDPDISLNEELFWFGEQIGDFCDDTNIFAQQCDIEKVYDELSADKAYQAWRKEVIAFAVEDEPDFEADEAFLKESYASGASAIDAAEDCVENFNDNATRMSN